MTPSPMKLMLLATDTAESSKRKQGEASNHKPAAPKSKKQKTQPASEDIGAGAGADMEAAAVACNTSAGNVAAKNMVGTTAANANILTDDDEVINLLRMTVSELQGKYETAVGEDWTQTNNIYSNAYRKAQKAGLTKNQAQLRGRVATSVFQKDNARLYLKQLAGPFRKLKAKKAKAAEISAQEKPADSNEELPVQDGEQ